MEKLLEKINEFTEDGAPSVGQLIALNDLAKKEGIKRNELEKLIAQAVEKNKTDALETPRETIQNNSFEPSHETKKWDKRPTYENNRESYIRPDTFKREEEVNRDFDATTFGSSTFETKHANFDEINKNFENANITGVKNTNYPDSKEREQAIKNENSIKQQQELTEEQKLDIIDAKIKAIVAERKSQGMPNFTRSQLFDALNKLRANYGLPKLNITAKEVTIEPAEAPNKIVFDKPKITVETPVFEPQAPPEHHLPIDEKLKRISSEIRAIAASYTQKKLPFTEADLITQKNILLSKYGLPEITKIEDFSEIIKEALSKKSQQNNDTFIQSEEEIERQIKIVKQKDAEKLAQQKKLDNQTKVEQFEAQRMKDQNEVIEAIKLSRTMGFVAVGIALFVFGLIGSIIGFVTLIRLNEQAKKMESLGLKNNEDLTKQFALARLIAIAAIIIGIVRFFNFMKNGF